MTPEIQKLKEWIAESDNIVFFGGAGVSTESGLADFRSRDGIYSRKYDFPYPPEKMLSHSFFMSNPDEFYDFHRKVMINENVRPNRAHIRLAELEKEGKLKAVITQNIDNLHQMAGSVNVLELHGSCYRNYCIECRKAYPISKITRTDGVPRCDCGGMIRPDVVLYEEALDGRVLSEAAAAIATCRMLIVGGTSLSVYPAAGLINYYRGNRLVLINNSPTPYDDRADLLITEKIGEVFAQV
jgi:NAD-dependent deacetylase